MLGDSCVNSTDGRDGQMKEDKVMDKLHHPGKHVESKTNKIPMLVESKTNKFPMLVDSMVPWAI